MRGFLPETLEAWLMVAGIVIGWAVATQRVWSNLVNKVNGVGARVALLEERKTENAARIARLEADYHAAAEDRTRIHEILGSITKENENLAQQLTDIKIDVIGHINEVKTMIREDVGLLRERLIRLEVMKDMETRRDG